MCYGLENLSMGGGRTPQDLSRARKIELVLSDLTALFNKVPQTRQDFTELGTKTKETLRYMLRQITAVSAYMEKENLIIAHNELRSGRYIHKDLADLKQWLELLIGLKDDKLKAEIKAHYSDKYLDPICRARERLAEILKQS